MIELKPKGRAVVTRLATPPESVAVPRTVVPFRNWTVPSGTPDGELTPAVSVTAWPTTEGPGISDPTGAAATVVVVVGKTVCVKDGRGARVVVVVARIDRRDRIGRRGEPRGRDAGGAVAEQRARPQRGRAVEELDRFIRAARYARSRAGGGHCGVQRDRLARGGRVGDDRDCRVRIGFVDRLADGRRGTPPKVLSPK